MKRLCRLLPAIALALTAFASASRIAGAQVASTTNQSDFLTTAGAVTVESFTSSYHYLLGSTLNSLSSYTPTFGGPVNPGDIQPGVTYSVNAGPLLIDCCGFGLVGGWLDGSNLYYGTDGPLRVTFDGAVSAFGYFWASAIAGDNTVTVNTTGGSYNFIFAASASPEFIGFMSTSADITGAVISGNSQAWNFAVDDFTFSAVQPVTSTPEPGTIALVATGLSGVFAATRRRRKTISDLAR